MGSFRLRVMAWNLMEPGADKEGLDRGKVRLQKIAQQVRQEDPDILVVNEIRKFGSLWPTWDCTAELSRMTSLPYHSFGATTKTGLTGEKGVAILSKYPLSHSTMHPVKIGPRVTGFGTLQAEMTVLGVRHQIFSTRFNAHDATEKTFGIQQATQLAQGVPQDQAVVFGGDFNATPEDALMVSFAGFSGLADAFAENPDPDACDPGHRIDYVFHRGPYAVAAVRHRCPWPGKDVSDHAWVSADLIQRPRVWLEQSPQPPALVSSGQDRLDTFVQGSDDALHHHRLDAASGVSGWTSLGGVLTSGPAAVTLGPGLVYVFARGTDNAIYYRWLSDGAAPSAWHRLPGAASSAPAACSSRPDRLDVFIKGTDDALYYQYMDPSSGWSGWTSLGGILTSAPSACSPAPGVIYCFVRGADDAVHYRVLADGVPSGWQRLPGATRPGPAACSSRRGRVDLFTRGTDSTLIHQSLAPGGGWSGWRSLGGVLTSGPGACTLGPDLDYVMVHGSDPYRSLYYAPIFPATAHAEWQRLRPE